MDASQGPIARRAIERRSQRRYPCAIPGALILEHGGAAMRVVVKDLSPGGALVECSDPHQKPVALAIAFKDMVAEMPVRVMGRRDTGTLFELRLAFGEVAAAERAALDAILKVLATHFADAQEELAERPNDPQHYRTGFQWPLQEQESARKRRTG